MKPSQYMSGQERILRWATYVARMEEIRTAYNILVENPREKRSLKRPSTNYEDNIKIDIIEIPCKIFNWIDLVHNIVLS